MITPFIRKQPPDFLRGEPPPLAGKDVKSGLPLRGDSSAYGEFLSAFSLH
jgi:hypothetical protein